jgi:type IV pilus assembly protein PilM
LTTQKEITSTERLLDLIRRKKDSAPVAGAMDAAASLERGIADAADTTALSLEKDSAAETATPYGASDTTVFSLEKDSAADAAGATGVAAPSVAKDIASAPGKTVRNRIKSAISLRSFSPRVLPFKKAGAVGVDIGHDDLRMVLATKSDGKWKLPALKKTPIPRDLSRTSDGFIEFLRRELSSFVGAKSYNIWTVVSPSEIEIRNLRIPKVPKKQIEDVVFWSVKKEFPFDEKESILDFEVLGEVIDQGIPKISVMAYIAPKQGAETLQRLFSRAGYPLNGISITPFAIQNLFRSGWMGAAGETIACLHVGFDYSRIDIFAGGNLTMTRDIKTGTNSMVESFVDQYNDKVRQTFSGSAEEIDMDGARKVVYALSPDSPQLSESDKGYNLQQEDIFEMIMPALERLVRQVERTCDYYNGTLGYEKVVRIHISGAIDSSMKLVAYVGSQLGIAAARSAWRAGARLLPGWKKHCGHFRANGVWPRFGYGAGRRDGYAESALYLPGQGDSGQHQTHQQEHLYRFFGDRGFVRGCFFLSTARHLREKGGDCGTGPAAWSVPSRNQQRTDSGSRRQIFAAWAVRPGRPQPIPRHGPDQRAVRHDRAEHSIRAPQA